jgi:hypothetical protein
MESKREASPAQIVSQEPSAVLPFVDRREASKKGLHESPYPFAGPSTDYERGWWDELRRMAREGSPTTRVLMADHLRRWAPLLRRMTITQRQEFHHERQVIASRFRCDLDGVTGDGERLEAEKALHAKWNRATGGTP